MKKQDLLLNVADELSLAPKCMAEVSANGVINGQESEWFTISEILKDSGNRYHNLVVNFGGLTVSDFLDYLEESELPITTNQIILDILDGQV